MGGPIRCSSPTLLHEEHLKPKTFSPSKHPLRHVSNFARRYKITSLEEEMKDSFTMHLCQIGIL
jgi:hypothetical protein